MSIKSDIQIRSAGDKAVLHRAASLTMETAVLLIATVPWYKRVEAVAWQACLKACLKAHQP